MGNLTRRQIIAIGAAVVFGPPILIGYLVGWAAGWFPGIIAGTVAFVLVLAVANVEVRKWLHNQSNKRDEGGEDKREP